MKNSPFSNTFKAKFKELKEDAIVVSRRLTLKGDPTMIIRDASDKIISVNDLKASDVLEIYVSSSEPYNILSARVLPVAQAPANN
jgi:hypothetical protein